VLIRLEADPTLELRAHLGIWEGCGRCKPRPLRAWRKPGGRDVGASCAPLDGDVTQKIIDKFGEADQALSSTRAGRRAFHGWRAAAPY